MSRWYLLNHQTFCFQTWYCDASLGVRVSCKKIYCYFQDPGHCKSSYDQNMTLSTIFSELLIPWQPNLVWWYIIRSQNVLWKTGLLHSGSRSQWRVKMLMFVQMMSSKPPNILFPNLVLWYIIMSRCVIYKYDFLIYYLSCWSFCNLVLMVHHHRVYCLVNRLDCSFLVKVKVTERIQNSSECSSW